MAQSGTVAGRPQPQTTAEPAGGPFVRHAPDGRRAMYVSAPGGAGGNFNALIANPMVSSPGWNKGYRILVAGTGGVNGTNTVTAATDAPWNWGQLIQMKDAFGTQLLTGPGYEALYLVPMYSGQFGTDLMRDPANSPQFQAISIGSSGTGNFQFGTYLPFEFAKGYGVISGANAALLPVLQINSNTSGTFYGTTSPGTVPTVTVTVDSDFYWLPNVPADPPGVGTTAQWIYQPCNPTIGSQASQFVQLPRLGGYLTMLILEMRDSGGARTETNTTTNFGWPTRPRILVDGVPLIDSLFTTLQEDLAISTGLGAFGGSTAGGQSVSSATSANQGTITMTRPKGTMGISRKTSMAQRDFGLLDTGEIFMSTNPGTQIEVGGFTWGQISSAPATLNAMVGQVVPSGALIRGLPEA